MRLSEVKTPEDFAKAIQDNEGPPVADNPAEAIKGGFRSVILSIVDGPGDIATKIKRIKGVLEAQQKAEDSLRQATKDERPPAANPADDKLPPKTPPKPDSPKSTTTAESFTSAVIGRTRLTEAEKKDFAGCIVR